MRLRIGMMRCLLTLHSPVQSSAAYALLVLGLFGLAVPEDLHKCSNNIDFGAMIPPDCTTSWLQHRLVPLPLLNYLTLDSHRHLAGSH